MNSKDRLFKRLAGEKVDRLPNLSILMSFAAKYAGIPYGRFCANAAAMAEANVLCANAFGIDVVTVMSDPYCETHDFGAAIVFPDDANPMCQAPLIKELSDIKKLKPVKPEDGKRMTERLKTLALYKERVGGEIPIVGWVESALAEYVDLRGLSEAMIDLFDDPDAVSEALQICTEQAVLFVKAQAAAGADIIGVGDAAASLVGGGLYERFALPYEKRIIAAIHEAGAKAKLHICGNTGSLLKHIAETKADIFDVDYMVALQVAADALNPAGTAVSGNLNPAGLLMEGTPAKIMAETARLTALGSATHLISSGCEVPRDTPPENLMAVARALRGELW